VGRDLAEGKLTLPIIEALEENTALRPKLEQMAHLNTDSATLDALQLEIADAVRAGGALERSRKEALRHANEARNALSPLPDSAWRDALAELSVFTATREK
jgi:octaprenyl-diphosphate synthase